jgi:hypothetical protein
MYLSIFFWNLIQPLLPNIFPRNYYIFYSFNYPVYILYELSEVETDTIFG